MTNDVSLFAQIPPGLVMVLGAFLIPFLRGFWRQSYILALPVLALYMAWQIPDGVVTSFDFLDYSIEPVEGSRVGRLFATIFTLMAFTGGIFAMRQKNPTEMVAAMVYAGSAVGVTFAGDMITMFVFWEIMALGSTLVVWCAGTPQAYNASMRYLLVHLLGGVVLMAGIIGEVHATGSIDFRVLTPDGGWFAPDSLARWLILIGFLVNAGAPPLSAWIGDTYPEASYTGTVFLSAFTTKTAVFVLWNTFPGTEILIWFGLYMVFYGIVYAILDNDMRRILAYSIVNQVGFMVTGIGIGTELALNGAAGHAFAHIIYKALLLMSAGSVFYMTGRRKCTDLGGLFQSMPVTATCGIVGALAISAFPWTSGFVTKSMVASSAAHEHLTFVWFMLAAASAGVFLHAGIKFPWFVFFQKDSGLRPKDPPFNMQIAMIFFSFLCVFIGVYPDPLYAILPYPVDYVPYTPDHVIGMLQLLLFAGLAFFICLPMLKRTLTITLDWDWFYRRLIAEVVKEFTVQAKKGHGLFEARMQRRMEHFIGRVFKHHGPEGIFARTWPTGVTVLWVAVLLAGYLLAYYF